MRLKTSLQVQPQTDSFCLWLRCSSRIVSRKHFFPELNTNSGEPCQAPHRDTIHEIGIEGMKRNQGKQALSISDKYVCLVHVTVWVPTHIHTEARTENMSYIFLFAFCLIVLRWTLSLNWELVISAKIVVQISGCVCQIIYCITIQ